MLTLHASKSYIRQETLNSTTVAGPHYYQHAASLAWRAAAAATMIFYSSVVSLKFYIFSYVYSISHYGFIFHLSFHVYNYIDLFEFSSRSFRCRYPQRSLSRFSGQDGTCLQREVPWCLLNRAKKSRKSRTESLSQNGDEHKVDNLRRKES